MPLIFLIIYNYIYNEIYMFHGYILYKVGVISPQSLRYKHTFPPLLETAFAEVSELFTHAVSARCLPQCSVLGVHPSGSPKRWKLEGAKWDCRKDEEG
jgi:hypothetical protein